MTSTRAHIRTVAGLVASVWLATLAGATPPTHGGRLVVPLRSEPSTLNPTTAVRDGEWAVIGRLHRSLVSIDPETLEPVPALAESWRVSDDGRVIDLALRRGLRFSDGESFDAQDVVLTFEALLDPDIASPWRSSFVVGGSPVKVEAVGTHAVRFELGEPRAAAMRLFDGIAILPSHEIRPLVEDGKWAGAWGVGTPPAEMAGLGPFRLSRYQPGERLVVERNPHYWKRDPRGRALPYLDEIEFVFVPDENAEVVRFVAGDADVVDNLSPENFLLLKRGGRDRVMTDVGPGLRYSFLFFNLNDLEGGGLEQVKSRQVWFRDRSFRQAVSLAIDRDGISRVVYRGRAAPLATLPSPGLAGWSHPTREPPRRDLDEARRKLREAGFAWRGGTLVDAERRPVRFSMLVSASSTTRRRIASLVQQDLEPLGIRAEVVPFDHGSLLQRVFGSHDYDAVIVELISQDADPTAYVDVLVSGGSTRLWRMDESPASDWERELDRLMREQALALDASRRRELYGRVLEIVATELPLIPLVSPNVLVGTRAGLAGCRPASIGDHLLWNADELYWDEPSR